MPEKLEKRKFMFNFQTLKHKGKQRRTVENKQKTDTHTLEKNLQGLGKLGFSLKVLQNVSGFCVRVLQVLCYANPSAEPSCRTPKVPQNSGGGGGQSICVK